MYHLVTAQRNVPRVPFSSFTAIYKPREEDQGHRDLVDARNVCKQTKKVKRLWTNKVVKHLASVKRYGLSRSGHCCHTIVCKWLECN
ncbi:hypothetical protein NPIL_148161 [Nephila pilipes]|uniref:Uncharacterized protein n=1 Tax=Nephila pilipes TaxID=299642 RepID=A0A8X6JJS9_NEPPI|nr:hypothetical protein NPIL_148161 [Nephila pilipes]